ncbi:hypothetical protein SAMN04487897_102655 [Paenibacillus sp. yr247]|nr:hypothetical protein SAMN04487897_102655 [Paenibacillus sp. yr247]
MINAALCLLAICLGLKGSIRIWKQHAKKDAIVLLLFYIIFIVYLYPFMGSSRLSVESLCRFIYSPISDYMMDLLKIRLEEL